MLIERGSRPVRLTEAGRLLLEQATQVLERVEDLRLISRRLHGAERPHVSVGFVGSTLYGYLPAVIRAYRAARPNAEVALLEMTTLEQISALKDHRIDLGFGRIQFEDPAIERVLLRNERLSAALPSGHALLGSPEVRLLDLVDDPLIVYPKSPRPSYADQVLALFRDQGLKPASVHEVRELQTALGLVAAESGITLVPAAVEGLRRENVSYRRIADEGAVSPIILSTRKGDRSPEITLIQKLIREIYAKERITFGV